MGENKGKWKRYLREHDGKVMLVRCPKCDIVFVGEPDEKCFKCGTPVIKNVIFIEEDGEEGTK
jgi:uncharacterized OB-fold protein